MSRKSRWAAAGATGLVAVLFAAGLAGFAAVTAPAEQAATAAPALPVAVMTVERQPGYSVRRAFVGRVEARRESRVGFELGGLVTDVLADEGDVVARGDVIGRLDTARLAVRLTQLRGERTALEAEIALAKATRARQERLAGLGHASEQRFDEARFREQALQGQLVAVDGEIATVELDMQKSSMLAPFDAIVAERMADEGIVIAAGAPVFDLMERAEPEVRIGVAGDAVDRIAVGQTHSLTVRGAPVPATVRAVLPVRDRGTRSVDVVLTLQAEFDGIRRGDLASLEIDRPVDQPGFWLPLTALTESVRGLWAVYVADGEDGARATLTRREMEVLYQEAGRVFARGTLSHGERVVVDGLHRLVPGQEVELTPAGEDAMIALQGRER
ncbi:MAG: efflux RND transporter periplasmic adaptor subunit [Minwuiales bacterium]|nr:efflux RND transporter periplasmic adaptor subunit [Minwuiales bacterium]